MVARRDGRDGAPVMNRPRRTQALLIVVIPVALLLMGGGCHPTAEHRQAVMSDDPSADRPTETQFVPLVRSTQLGDSEGLVLAVVTAALVAILAEARTRVTGGGHDRGGRDDESSRSHRW